MRLAGFQGLLGSDAFGDITGHLGVSEKLACFILQQGQGDMGDETRPVLTQAEALLLVAPLSRAVSRACAALPPTGPSGMWKVEKCRPRISSPAHPVICSAPAFQPMIRPSVSSMQIA